MGWFHRHWCPLPPPGLTLGICALSPFTLDSPIPLSLPFLFPVTELFLPLCLSSVTGPPHILGLSPVNSPITTPTTKLHPHSSSPTPPLLVYLMSLNLAILDPRSISLLSPHVPLYTAPCSSTHITQLMVRLHCFSC